MSTDHDTTRIVRSWLDAGVTELPDRVLDAVLDAVPATPQRRAGWRARRFPVMNNIVKVGLAAAAVVVLAFVLVNVLPGSGLGIGGDPSAEPTVEPTPTAQPTSTPDAGLPLGPFSFEPDGPFSPYDSGMTLTVTIPAPDWGFEPTWNLLGGPGASDPFIAFWALPDEQFYVPADPCRGDSTRPATPATTVDEIAAALAAQASRNASEPVDVMIGGYAGKSLILHAPEGVDAADCEQGEIITYFTATGGADGNFWRNTQRSDEVSELWILDVDGTIVIIDAVSSPATSTELVEETRTAVESTTFDLP